MVFSRKYSKKKAQKCPHQNYHHNIRDLPKIIILKNVLTVTRIIIISELDTTGYPVGNRIAKKLPDTR